MKKAVCRRVHPGKRGPTTAPTKHPAQTRFVTRQGTALGQTNHVVIELGADGSSQVGVARQLGGLSGTTDVYIIGDCPTSKGGSRLKLWLSVRTPDADEPSRTQGVW